MVSKPTPKLSHLQCLRGLAALTVVLSHFPHWTTPGKWTVTIYNTGFLAVYVFFAISGYIIAYSHRGETGPAPALAYGIKRIFRLYPAYLFYSAAALAVYAAGWENWDNNVILQKGVKETIAAFNLLQIPSCRIISFLGVGWSLFFEVVFYLFFLAFFISRRTGIAVMTLFAIGIRANETVVHNARPFWLSAKSLLFVAGCALGLYRGRLRLSRGGCWLLGLGGLVLLGAALLFGGSSLAPPSALVGAACVTLCAIGLDHTAGDRPCGFWHRALHRLGDVSYSLYLCHTVVHAIVYHFFGAPQESWIAAVLFVAAPIGVAWLSYQAIERPLQQLARWVIKRAAVPRAAAA